MLYDDEYSDAVSPISVEMHEDEQEISEYVFENISKTEDSYMRFYVGGFVARSLNNFVTIVRKKCAQ
jgi:hypothetical protein